MNEFLREEKEKKRRIRISPSGNVLPLQDYQAEGVDGTGWEKGNQISGLRDWPDCSSDASS